MAYTRKSNSILTKNTHPSLYQTWANMKTRCFNKNSIDYRDYGDRGIGVCKEWLTFANFAEDMLPTFVEGLTLDRINNNEGYSPENCRWATPKQQALNRRSNRLLLYRGVTKHLTVWANELGIKRTTISQRLDYYGWTVDRALSTKARS